MGKYVGAFRGFWIITPICLKTSYLRVFRKSALALGLALLFCASSMAQTAGPPENAPLETIRHVQDTITITLPKDGVRYLIASGNIPSRLSEYGETIVLKEGEHFFLTGKHEYYMLTARFTPQIGLKVKASFDGRSLGGEFLRKEYFLPAR